MKAIRPARTGVATVFFLNGFGYGSWVPRIAEIQDKVGISDGQLGLALFMAAVGALLAMPLAGAAAHRYGSRIATAVTVALFGLSLPGLALAPDLIGLGFALLVVGAAAGALDVSMNAQGVAVEKHYWRPIMSSLHGMFSLGAMAGAGATGLIAALEVPLCPISPASPADPRGRRAGVSADAAGGRRTGRRGPRLRAAVARHPAAGPRGARGPPVGGRHGRLERGVPQRQPGRRTSMAAAAFAAFFPPRWPPAASPAIVWSPGSAATRGARAAPSPRRASA